ncbi:DUF1636 family protein [Pseudoroseomonas globiformis]|uniref:DUF1636 family protein n=1 Tax=Teichococcus globiformis TaxID=2307229 RepID=A0ABV7FT94_9PROT
MQTEPTEAHPPTLVVCTTCRARRPLAEGETAPGRILHDAVAEALAAAAGTPLRLRAVACLSACEHGCTAVMMAPGKWSYLLGGLDHAAAPDLAADLIAYAATYHASANGAVLRSRRPESLRHAVLGRVPSIPPQDPTA